MEEASVVGSWALKAFLLSANESRDYPVDLIQPLSGRGV